MTRIRHRTRGSSADREINCAGAIGWRGPEYNPNSPVASTGTAVHAALAPLVETGEGAPDLHRSTAADPTMFDIAYQTGVKVWRDKLSAHFPDAKAEQRLEGETTCGTCDILSVSPERIVIGDWKLGQSEDEHPNQLRAYALAAVDQFWAPPSGDITLVEIWLMRGAYNVDVVTLDELERFRATLQHQHARAGEQFAAGPWCKYCPVWVDCGVRDQYMLASAKAIAEVAPGELSRETLGRLWDRSRQLKGALVEYERAVRAALDEGPIDIGDGRRISLEESERWQFPRPTDVAHVLRGDVDEDRLYAVSKASIERAIKAMAPKGQAAGRIRLALAKLEQQGLVDKATTKRIRVGK